MTVREAAEAAGIKVWDTAFPMRWLDEMLDKGIDPRGHFVWSYDVCTVFGAPAPITEYGRTIHESGATGYS
jgi:hypothetical protein